MISDCIEYAKSCKVCQYHADLIHQPPEPLHVTTCSWPFATWGMDIIGAFTPPSSAGHQYLLAATDYFSKWAEAIAVKDFKNTTVSEFIRTQIIYRFGIPDSIISDNGQPFRSSPLYRLYAKYNIKPNLSSRYYAAANGLAEAFNKTLCKILKMTKTRKIGMSGSRRPCGHTELRVGLRLKRHHTRWSSEERQFCPSKFKYPLCG